MSAGIDKGQFGLVYGHKILTKIGVYFKQKFQSNNLL